MINAIKSNLLAPLGTRIGTLVTGGLVGMGINAVHADWVGTGVAGALLIGCDLMLAWLRKQAIVNKAFKQIMGTLYPDEVK